MYSSTGMEVTSNAAKYHCAGWGSGSSRHCKSASATPRVSAKTLRLKDVSKNHLTLTCEIGLFEGNRVMHALFSFDLMHTKCSDGSRI